MHSTTSAPVRRYLLALAITAALTLPVALHAQDKPDREAAYGPRIIQTFYLHNATTDHDLNDIQTSLRNMLPWAKIYGDPHVAAISLSANAADLASAQKLINELDRPKKTWRLTYTVTETDGAKDAAPQHFTLTVSENAKASLKQGTKVPIVTGKYEQDKASGPETQVQYLDVGIGIESTLSGYENGVHLNTKFEQSAVADDKGQHTDDPIIAQTFLETSSAVEAGKQVALGSVAEPNSPHHVAVSVMAELVK